MIDGQTTLLYRGSLYGYTAKAFHDRCNGKGPTICIIRSNLK